MHDFRHLGQINDVENRVILECNVEAASAIRRATAAYTRHVLKCEWQALAILEQARSIGPRS